MGKVKVSEIDVPQNRKQALASKHSKQFIGAEKVEKAEGCECCWHEMGV